jgi:acyl-CoA thioester hydrolase
VIEPCYSFLWTIITGVNIVDNIYSQNYTVRWSDLDANGHMRNTAFIECGMQVRLAFFAEHGFPFSEFQKQQFGPVIFREEIVYLKEVRMLETIRTSFHFSKLSDDGARFTLVNTLFKEADVKAAELISEGAWFDLKTRKLVPPPTQLNEIMQLIYHPDPLPVNG